MVFVKIRIAHTAHVLHLQIPFDKAGSCREPTIRICLRLNPASEVADNELLLTQRVARQAQDRATMCSGPGPPAGQPAVYREIERTPQCKIFDLLWNDWVFAALG
jgi:hypothetical protein